MSKKTFKEASFCRSIYKLWSYLCADFYYKKRKTEIDQLFKDFEAKELIDFCGKRNLVADIAFTDKYFGFKAEAYFRYQFYNLSDNARAEFINNEDRIKVVRKFGNKEIKKLFKNKYNTYQRFKKYYKRDALLIDAGTDLQSFDAFCVNNESFIVKPSDMCGGHGVYVKHLEKSYDCEQELKALQSEGEFVVEGLIQQAEGMKKFHPQSVNTVRLVTFLRDGKMELIAASVRFGVGDSVVDNGCLSAAVDCENGIILTRGRQAHCTGLYAIHPDSGEQIIGAKIPQWKELLELAEELVKVVPEQRLIGWDMALGVDGWTVVEANTSPAIQILAGERMGMKKIFEGLK